MISTWPDGTPKSSGNAFDWRTTQASIAQCYEFKASEAAARRTKIKPSSKFTVYSKAKPSK